MKETQHTWPKFSLLSYALFVRELYKYEENFVYEVFILRISNFVKICICIRTTKLKFKICMVKNLYPKNALRLCLIWTSEGGKQAWVTPGTTICYLLLPWWLETSLSGPCWLTYIISPLSGTLNLQSLSPWVAWNTPFWTL